jgi:hypothetical protein
MLRIAFAAALCASSASAATMTFDNLYDYANNAVYLGSTYTESGITVTGNGALGYFDRYAVHMDDFYAPSPSRLTFTMGSRFNAMSMVVSQGDFFYWQCAPGSPCTMPTYQNVMIQGYRTGSIVSTLLLDSSLLPFGPLTLGGAFANLDSLSIEVYLPAAMTTGLPAGYTWDCGFPCSHFEVDNVTLAPVPLPGALGMVVAGLAALGLARRRRA